MVDSFKMVKQLNDTFSYYSDSYSTMETLPLISSDMSNMTLLQIARWNKKGAGRLKEGCRGRRKHVYKYMVLSVTKKAE